jgi:Rieske Fe-S protein
MHNMAENSGFPVPPTRRSVVAAAGGAGLAAVLTACGGSDADTADGASSGTTPSKTSERGGTALGKTSEIPVGGGKIFDDQKVVVTQPTAGQFKGFSSVCTHQGCGVSSVSDGTIDCACHGSKFRVADGSVETGPAVVALPAAEVTVSGDEIMLA